jgi:hypothetical protein
VHQAVLVHLGKVEKGSGGEWRGEQRREGKKARVPSLRRFLKILDGALSTGNALCIRSIFPWFINFLDEPAESCFLETPASAGHDRLSDHSTSVLLPAAAGNRQ